MEKRTTGVVRWFDGVLGFGYIHAEGQEVQVHATAIRGPRIKHLLEGETVEFVLAHSVRGPQALDVIRLN